MNHKHFSIDERESILESLTLGEKAGLDPAQMIDIINASTGSSRSSRTETFDSRCVSHGLRKETDDLLFVLMDFLRDRMNTRRQWIDCWDCWIMMGC